MGRPLRLEYDVVRQMLAACQNAYPAEACGLLSGASQVATSHQEITNVATKPTERFEMDPRELEQAFERIKRQEERLIAVYHSHPSTSPVPSKADLEQATDLSAYYVIVGLASGAPRIRAFRIDPRVRRAVEVRWYPVGRSRARAAASGRDFYRQSTPFGSGFF